MVDHKQATEVSIASVEDQSEFSAWVFRWWKPASFVLLVGAIALLANQYLSESNVAEEMASWEALDKAISVDNPNSYATADADVISGIATSQGAGLSGPWARYLEASVRDQDGDHEGSVAALSQLTQDHPDHLLNNLRIQFQGQSTRLTVAERLSQSIQDQGDWEASHPSLFKNPDPAAGSPKVRLITTEGPILVELYSARAPKHVENFLKLCGDGFYDGTRFHRVIAGFMVQGGDPNSKEADVDTWGQGGPGYKVEREENELKHFIGFLAAAKMSGEAESSGSQFYITTGPAHHLDGQHVVFGKVLEGMDTVGIIESTVIVPGTSRPETPATITGTETL